MNIFLRKEEYSYLTYLAKSNVNEIAGDLVFERNGNDYYLVKMKNVNNKQMIDNSTRKSIDINLESFLTELIYEVYQSRDDKGVVVRFHTHPKGLAYPSDANKKFISARQKSLELTKRKYSKDYTYVEAIINPNEIGFYYTKDGKYKRAHAFVDGEEMIPRMPNNKSARKSFLDGFKEGFKKEKNK